MKKSKFYTLISWVALLFIIFSCERAEVISEKKVFDNQIWNRFDILEFDFTIENPDITYDVKLDFDHNDKYFTDHLTTNITFFMPGGSMRSRDYTFKLKNDKLEWLGTPEKTTISHQLPIILGMKFPDAGNYKMRVESKMAKFNLQNVKAVELNIQEAK